jgi:superfamily II DNA/RNA helicase
VIRQRRRRFNQSVLAKPLRAVLNDLGVKKPTAVQIACIPPTLAGQQRHRRCAHRHRKNSGLCVNSSIEKNNDFFFKN